MAGYTRQSTFADGDTITAALFNNEYNQLLNAFSNTSGHSHDGTANEGPVIGLIGDAGETAPNNKVLIDTTNNYIEFYVQVSDSPVQQLYIADGAIVPVTDNDIDLGTSSLQFKDLYINGTANIDSLVLATGSTVTAVLDEDDLSSDSATSLVTQQSVKAYIDAQVTAQDLDFLGDSGGALSIDLDSESLTIAGGTGLDTVGSGNTVTVNIDATVATLTGSQTLTNKTIDVDNNTVSNIEVDNFKASAIVLESEGIGSNDNDTSLPTSAAVKDYVDTQITAEDLDITTDSGTIAIDLDSETLTVSGGTGLDSSATGNAVTLAIDSTVTTLTGTQTLTNKTLTSPDVNTPDIDGGTIDGATIATSDVTVGAGKTLDVSAGTLTLADNQISGDKVEGGTIAATTITDLTFGSLNDGTITATAFVDEDNMASNSATLIPTQQSVKAYVDTTVAATNEVVEDTTPQLGGDLDLNSSDITGTGNINITGTIQSSGNITGTLATAAQPNITSVGTLTGLTTTGDINFGDNDIAKFGADADLKIYHNSNGNSIISETGGGDLFIQATNLQIENAVGDNMIFANSGGAVNLYYAAAAKLATTSTGIDVTGTVTADGLTVDGSIDFANAIDGVINAPFSCFINIDSNNNSTGDIFVVGRNATGTTSAKMFEVRESGDISFYDDTGTSQALYWDASAESLGIGTTSPDDDLHIANNTQAGPALRLENQSVSTDSNTIYASINFEGNDNSSGANGIRGSIVGKSESTNGAMGLLFSTASAGGSNTERMRIDSSGNVGIGTDSPSAPLQITTATLGTAASVVAAGTNAGIYLEDDATATDNFFVSKIHNPGNGLAVGGIKFAVSPDGSNYNWSGVQGLTTSSGNCGTLAFYTSASSTSANSSTEAMRIDSSGNVLVGKTTTSNATAGAELNASGQIVGTFAGGTHILGRNSSDGSVLEFQKDGLPVGSIGTTGGDMYVGTGDCAIRFSDGGDQIRVCTNAGSNRDGAIDLGFTDSRFKDLYLSGGAYLGGTGSANKLDDYEEGTWTPAFEGATSNTGAANTGTYVKVGQLCHCTIHIHQTALTGTATASMTGLPFAAADVANIDAFCIQNGGHTLNTVSTNNGRFRLEGNATTMKGVKSLGTTTFMSYNEFYDGSGTLQVRAHFTYRTT